MEHAQLLASPPKGVDHCLNQGPKTVKNHWSQVMEAMDKPRYEDPYYRWHVQCLLERMKEPYR